MNILHYNLGFPPYRSGGLTAYSLDIAKAQQEMGHNVCILWPGRIQLFNHTVKFCEGHNSNYNLNNFEIINPQFVPLMNGIKNPKLFMKKTDTRFIKLFFDHHDFDILHIHTLMGIHKEFIEEAKKRRIKIVFTSHDYFGIASNPIIYYEESSDSNNVDLFRKSDKAFNRIVLFAIQTKLYRTLKNSSFLRKLKNKFKMESQFSNFSYSNINPDFNNSDFDILKCYYNEIFAMVDFFHFNSFVSENVYNKHIIIKESKVITISNSYIVKRNVKSTINREKIRFAFFGDVSSAKGFGLIQDASRILNGYFKDKFEVSLYTNTAIDEPYFLVNRPFGREMLSDVLENIDILLVPSICYETFGLVVLEALSFNVPVIVSNIVGASALIVDNKNGLIIEPNVNALFSAMQKCIIDINLVNHFKTNIFHSTIKTIHEHAFEMENIYIDRKKI